MRKIFAVVLLAAAVVIALALATGVSLPLGSSNATPTAGPNASTAGPTAIQGRVRASARRLKGQTWQFIYRVHNAGSLPIAGFQLNGAASNLFDITTRGGWNAFGRGVCNKGPSGVLAYWSTSSQSPTVLRPGGTATFRFKVQTAGTAIGSYSLSWQNATPRFGKVRIPSPSSLPALGPCKARVAGS